MAGFRLKVWRSRFPLYDSFRCGYPPLLGPARFGRGKRRGRERPPPKPGGHADTDSWHLWHASIRPYGGSLSSSFIPAGRLKTRRRTYEMAGAPNSHDSGRSTRLRVLHPSPLNVHSLVSEAACSQVGDLFPVITALLFDLIIDPVSATSLTVLNLNHRSQVVPGLDFGISKHPMVFNPCRDAISAPISE